MKFLEEIQNIKVELDRADSIFCSGLEPKYVKDNSGNQFRIIDIKEPFRPILSMMDSNYEPTKNETGQWHNFGSYANLVRRRAGTNQTSHLKDFQNPY